MHTYIERPKIPGVNLGLFYANNALEELTLKSVTEDTLALPTASTWGAGNCIPSKVKLVGAKQPLAAVQELNLVTLPIGC